jgi:hypothetical protein
MLLLSVYEVVAFGDDGFSLV